MADKGKKNKKGRKAYLNDIRPNLAGEYVYVGDYYTFVPDGKSFPRALAEIIICSLLGFLGLVCAGFVEAGGMGNCFYVIIPYMGEAISLFVLLWAVSKLLFKGSKLREYVYGSSVLRIPGAATVTAAFAGAGALAIIVFTVLNGIDGSAGEYILLLLGKALNIAAMLMLRKLMKSLSWKVDGK